MKFKNLMLCALTCTLTISAYSQTKSYKNEFGFRSDNDAYLGYGQDRYYTNGLFITFRRAMDQSKLKGVVNKRIWEIEGGHKMYNPISGNVSDISKIDRPFAAYLYVGGSFNWLYNSENNLKITLQAGTIGPSALGEEVQSTLHNLVGFYPIKGWESQIKDEFGLNTAIEYNRFLHRTKSQKADFSITSYAHLGNTFSGAGAGLLFRTGLLNQLFNSVSTNSIISNNSATQALNEKEFFFYAKPTVHFIAYDATIQGGMFRDDKGPVTFDVKPLVFSQEFGAIYAKNRWTIDFSTIFKSREVKSTAKAHQYGSIALYYRFN